MQKAKDMRTFNVNIANSATYIGHPQNKKARGRNRMTDVDRLFNGYIDAPTGVLFLTESVKMSDCWTRNFQAPQLRRKYSVRENPPCVRSALPGNTENQPAETIKAPTSARKNINHPFQEAEQQAPAKLPTVMHRKLATWKRRPNLPEQPSNLGWTRSPACSNTRKRKAPQTT